MRKFLLSLATLVLLLPALGLAADIRSAEVVGKTEKPKNLYVAGQNPTVDADVVGDLVVAGGVVTVNGSVQNGVLAAGGTLNLNGAVGQSVRVAGGTILLDSTIGGDLVVFGGDVTLGTKSVVSGDVIVFAGTVTLKGEVVGGVKSYAGNVIVAGKVGGNVELGQVGTLKLESSAVIGGDLKYTSKTEGTIARDAKVGGKVEYTKLVVTNLRNRNNENRFGSILFGMLMAFVTVLVFIKLLPKFAGKVVNSALVNPWAKLGIGFLTMIAVPVVMLVLLFTVVGWGVMGYLGTAYMATFALTGTLTAMLAGSVVWKYFRKEKELVLGWQTAAVGVVLVAVAKLVPVVGWLAVFVAAMIVFGTLTTMGYEYVKAQRA